MTDQKSTYWMSALELQLNATSVHYFSLDSPQHSWWFLAFSFKCLYRVHNSLFVCSYILIYWRITSVVCSGTYIFSTPLQMLLICYVPVFRILLHLSGIWICLSFIDFWPSIFVSTSRFPAPLAPTVPLRVSLSEKSADIESCRLSFGVRSWHQSCLLTPDICW